MGKLDIFVFSQHGNGMICCSPSVNNAIPNEFRKIAEDLFPPCGISSGVPPGSPAGKGPTVRTTEAFAGIRGIEGDYKRLLNLRCADEKTTCFLESFQNNLDLLIQKTWVEKADETRKEKLQDRIPPFISSRTEGNYQKALGEFGAILEELAYLFFGAQSHKDDFTEYTFRIDTQMGLFWWYGGQINRLQLPAEGKQDALVPDKDSLWAVLLLGICYLTNF
jgi:hypothetical protein